MTPTAADPAARSAAARSAAAGSAVVDARPADPARAEPLEAAAYPPATRPTLCFIGVTTAQSSIMRVFPAWAAHLGLGEVEMRGIDFPLHAEAQAYRAAVDFLRHDPLVTGRARHHAQDRPLRRLPGPLRRPRRLRRDDGRDVVPVEARRSPDLPCQGSDQFRTGHRRLPCAGPFRPDRGGGAGIRGRGIGHRDHLASDAQARRPAHAHRRDRPRAASAGGDPPDPRCTIGRTCPVDYVLDPRRGRERWRCWAKPGTWQPRHQRNGAGKGCARALPSPTRRAFPDAGHGMGPELSRHAAFP